MITHSGDIRIFNTVDKKVITYVKDKKDFERFEEIKEIFSKYLNTTIIELNQNKSILIENYLPFIPFQEWTSGDLQESMTYIFNSYGEYFRNIKISHSIIIEDLMDNYNLPEEISLLFESTISPDYFQEEWPVVKIHGDLNINNILLHSGKYYLIDWEDFGDYIFFYDFINIIYTPAMHLQDYSLIENFLEGKYDREFNNIFNILGMKYQSNRKLYYIALYMVERIIKVEKIDSITSNVNLLERYISTWEMIESLNLKIRDEESKVV